jgi:nicotinate-nucleotide pyrophosphorylase (carboxylating)
MDRSDYESVVETALAEDLGEAGDITTRATVSPEATVRAHLVARQPGVVAGLGVAEYVFRRVDPHLEFRARNADGDRVTSGDVLAEVSGHARSILGAERTALNLLGRMSGVATATAQFVAAVEGTGARISDTRKTMPGLRVLDKHAVAVGGGLNHRFGLYDAVMIKDNHLVAAGSITGAVRAAREAVGPDITVEVEIETLGQLEEVLMTDADRVLLDNMDAKTLAEAVAMAGSKIVTEASGGVTLDNVRDIADTGVDIISIGWITHSAPQLDIALDFLS